MVEGNGNGNGKWWRYGGDGGGGVVMLFGFECCGSRPGDIERESTYIYVCIHSYLYTYT